MRKILITGSEGFVGQHIVNLLKSDNFLIGLSRNTKLKNEHNVEYVLGDIQNKQSMLDILKKYHPDVILHLASISKTWNNDPSEVFNVNVLGTINIYEAVLQLKIEDNFNPKIIFISSAEVYGKSEHPENITEESLLNPINDYAASKAASDRLSFKYSQYDHLNIVILRPFPHTGPGQRQGFFVPDTISQIVTLEKSPDQNELFVGNLQSIRDYSDVRDTVNAYKKVIEIDFEPGEVFNICSGIGIKIEGLLDKLLSLTTKKIVVKQDQSKLRAVDLPVFVGNNKKFISKTGWKQQYTLDQTLKDTMEYWRNLQK